MLTGRVLPQPPGRVENLLFSPWASQGEPISRERSVSVRKGKILLLLSKVQLRSQKPQPGLPRRRQKQDVKGEKFLKTEASPKRKEVTTRF